MKRKVLALTMTAAMALSMAACGSSASSEASSSETSSVEESSVEESSVEESSVEIEADETTITIFIAASLDKAFEDEGKLIDMYKELQPNVTIEVNAGSSGALETSIEEGSACDLFFSAGAKQVTAAQDAGYVIDGSVVNLLENKVVLVKRAGDTDCKVTGFDNMTEAKSMALCADSVPAGQYARKIFENLGISDQFVGDSPAIEINECDKVTSALSAVAQGTSEIGIVYASDAANEAGVEVIAEATAAELPENPLYPVCLIDNHGADDTVKAAAANFEEFLQSDEALAVFADYTFILHEE